MDCSKLQLITNGTYSQAKQKHRQTMTPTLLWHCLVVLVVHGSMSYLSDSETMLFVLSHLSASPTVSLISC